jgi:hypothetical protein
MTYLHASTGKPIARETILELSRLVGVSIPEEDLDQLSTALRDQLAAVDRIESLDLRGIAPRPCFEVLWHE